LLALIPGLSYPICVQTFSMPADAWSPRGTKKLLTFLLSFSISALALFALKVLVNHFSLQSGILGMALESLAVSFFLTVWIYRRREELRLHYELVIDDDVIRLNFGSDKALYCRSVNREKIQTLVESEKRLLVSEHGRVMTFFLGGVWVPRKLPDYEYVKRLVTNWQDMDETAAR
jgi:hypothetical protein